MRISSTGCYGSAVLCCASAGRSSAVPASPVTPCRASRRCSRFTVSPRWLRCFSALPGPPCAPRFWAFRWARCWGQQRLVAHLLPVAAGTRSPGGVLNAVPAIALGPIFIILVSREFTPALLATIPAFFMVYVAMTSGLRYCASRLNAMMTTFGARKGQLLVYLEMPSALPSLLNGMKVSVTAAMIGAIVGEWFGAPTGLGVVILNTLKTFRYR